MSAPGGASRSQEAAPRTGRTLSRPSRELTGCCPLPDPERKRNKTAPPRVPKPLAASSESLEQRTNIQSEHDKDGKVRRITRRGSKETADAYLLLSARPLP